MTIWNWIRCGLFMAAAIALSPDGAWAQQKQDGPSVSTAPRPAVQETGSTATAKKTAAAIPVTAPITTLELAVDSSMTVSVETYSEIIVSQEAIANVRVDSNRPEKVRVFGRKIGSTNIFFLDRRGEVVRHLEVHVTLDNGAVRYAISKLLPNENIKVTSYRDTIFLSGYARTAASARQATEIARRFVSSDDNVKNMVSITGSQQVIIQVRVAEMERSVRKELSANLDSFTVGGAVISTTNTLLNSPVDNFNYLSASFINGGQIDVSALEAKSLAKTLAEPTLVAASGETAKFLSGGEIPYIAGTDDNGNATYEFKEYGIQLGFTPVIMDQGNISMNIALEVSALDKPNYVNNVPALTTKKTETNIDMPSGGSIMISGLIQDDESNGVAGVPILKDIPILGALFRSTEVNRTEKELVVIVNAYLAKATDNKRPLAAPTDGFESASDLDIYLLGRLQRTYGKSMEPIWKDPLIGPYGYIMR